MKKLSLFTLIGMIAGILVGFLMPDIAPAVSFIGTYYITVLKAMIGPVIFCSICVSIYDARNRSDKMVIKSVITFIVMFVVSFLLSSLLVVLIDPANGFVIQAQEYEGVIQEFHFLDMIKNLFPKSLKDIFVSPKVFFIIAIAYLCGFFIGKINDDSALIKGVRHLKDFLFKVLGYVMFVTPFAAFSLMSTTVANNGILLLGVGVRYILTAYLCGLTVMIVVMILPVWLISRRNPFVYIQKIYKIWIMTLTTCSSAATLPYTMKTCKEDLGIPDRISDVVVPLGCTIHMCGGAVSFALLGLFNASLYGMEVSFGTFMVMIAASLAINMAAPGIPNGGVVIGATYLQLLGLPLGFIGFYSGIYKLLDMLYTTLNVTGDITANVLLETLVLKKES